MRIGVAIGIVSDADVVGIDVTSAGPGSPFGRASSDATPFTL
jgi:hypothetical protein